MSWPWLTLLVRLRLHAMVWLGPPSQPGNLRRLQNGDHGSRARGDTRRHRATAALIATRRGLTLEAVSADTGITVSTLSRLESGKRRPTLDLLIPLARAYRVALDQLVAAPATGDPGSISGLTAGIAAMSWCR